VPAAVVHRLEPDAVPSDANSEVYMRSPESQQPNQTGVDEAVKELGDATAAKKCWHCGCLHSSLRAIEEAYRESARPESLAAIVQLARSRLRSVATVAGYLPERMISDPAGYFVVFPDCGRQLLMLEHYRNDGVLDAVIEGRTSAELYIPAIEKSLVPRLDHAAYLGEELARAEQALLKGESFVQDAAPELQTLFPVVNEDSTTPSACVCGTSCGGNKP